MKISLDAAMRARDVSQPSAADEIAAAELDTDVSTKNAVPARQPHRARVRGRLQPGQGSAGSSPDSS